MNSILSEVLGVRKALLLLAVGGLWAWGGCKESSRPVQSQPAGGPQHEQRAEVGDERPEGPSATIITAAPVEGMTCEGCAQTIATRLLELEGVQRTRVSFNKRTAWLVVEPGSGPELSMIVEKISEIGYSVGSPGETTRPAGEEAPDSGPAV